METFDELKEICRRACHERNACKPGFEALMQADSIPAILAVWRQNWDDIFSSKFADVMAEHIAGVYATAGDEFRSARFYVNEPSERGIVIISGATEPIAVGGTAKAYIFSPDHPPWSQLRPHRPCRHLCGGARVCQCKRNDDLPHL